MRTYDPAQIVIQFGPYILSGYQDGTFVKAGRDGDTFTKYVGTDGEVSRARSRNKSGNVEVTLAQTSITNDLLSGVQELDELTGAGVYPFTIKDLNGTTLLFAPEAWIKKPADTEYGKEIGPRAWLFDTGKMETFTGGSLL
jgi:hypothetical protein